MEIGNGNLKRYMNRTLPESFDNKRILLIRRGGIGDMMMLLPFAAWVKRQSPSCRVGIGMRKTLMPVVEGSPAVDWVMEWTSGHGVYKNWDCVINFKGVIESNPRSQWIHGVDIHWDWVGEDWTKVADKEKIPQIVVKERSIESIERLWKRWEISKKYKAVIAIQLSASSVLRTWHPEYNRVLSKLFAQQGVGVIILDQHTYFEFREEGVFNYCGRLDLEDWVALINKVDMTIGPDSGASHIAGALGKLFLGVYSSFDPDLRLRYYENSYAVTSNYECAPCFFHHHDLCKRRKIGMPVPCMIALKPSVVYCKVRELMRKYYGFNLEEYDDEYIDSFV